jgi:hypothetical protein
MPMYEDRAMLNKYSMKIHVENQHITRADCMKIALKKLRNDKKMKEFIHNKSRSIKKNNPELSHTQSIMTAVKEWKKIN